MIGYLQGEILEHLDGKMLIGVGDRNLGSLVGYSVSVPQSPQYGGYTSAQKIELYIHTHVREDAFELFGFHSQFEKLIFLTLVSVNGIGPRSALGILSSVQANQLVDAIMEGDRAYLTQIPGIGKKTAERIVIELQDTIRKKVSREVSKSSGSGQISPADPSSQSHLFQDAKSALLTLGYREQEVHQHLTRVFQDTENRPTRIEEVIRTALRSLT